MPDAHSALAPAIHENKSRCLIARCVYEQGWNASMNMNTLVCIGILCMLIAMLRTCTVTAVDICACLWLVERSCQLQFVVKNLHGTKGCAPQRSWRGDHWHFGHHCPLPLQQWQHLPVCWSGPDPHRCHTPLQARNWLQDWSLLVLLRLQH